MTDKQTPEKTDQPKKTYIKPEVERLGDFFEITQGGGGGGTDGGGGAKGGIRRDGGPGSPKTKSGSSG